MNKLAVRDNKKRKQKIITPHNSRHSCIITLPLVSGFLHSLWSKLKDGCT
ncbi:hypothetical protein HanRHA438_Chr01g0009551 [Helianthus annuus]|nr:hypothetical protein HanIR_Chr01g0010191 [Helianthus annuus]KAJ0946938.1 hypothetical protein HanRHA438_Chr01g0009551 [Helianthus annuus]